METLKNKLNSYYSDFCVYMQNDTIGEEIAIYTVSGAMLLFAYHRIRPISKFGKATDIPKHFITNKIKQYGSIKAIDPSSKSGPVLLVDHKPPLNFLIPFKKLLPVNLTGIAVNANGYSWLQTVTVGHKIEFVPISKKQGNAADCKVYLICPNNKKEKLDISEALLSLGFGKIVEPEKKIIKDIEWKKYYKFLSKVEHVAKNDRLGLWSNSLPPKSWAVRKSREAFKSIILSILPAERRLPELVR